jgi:uncharacterized DUF497 family protein
METSSDAAKRAKTLQERGLDLEVDGAEMFRGRVATVPDKRFDYGEDRFVSAGFLCGRFVVVVWTPRDDKRHVISMRYGHEREKARWLPLFD